MNLAASYAPRPGGRVQQWDCHGGRNQQWSYGGNGTFMSSNGMCLDVNGPDFESRRNGGVMQVWPCHGGSNQAFQKRH